MPAILCYLMAGLFGCDPVHRPRDLPSWLTKSIPDDMLDGMRVRESVIKGAGGPLRRFALKRLLTVPPTTPAVDAAARNGFTLEAGKALETVWVKLDRIAEPYRQGNIEQSILEGKTSKTTLDSLDGIRWLHRLAYHAWRIVFHLAQAGTGVAAKPDAPILREESDPIDE